jgi:2-iminobutanoate/2-iminopropanoate deaminase
MKEEEAMERRVVHTDRVPPARVPLSQAIKAGSSPRASSGWTRGAVCENLKAVLEAAGSSLARVVKVTIYMADLAELMAMNGVFSSYFPKDPPARTTFQAAGLVAGARVEIEAIAIL